MESAGVTQSVFRVRNRDGLYWRPSRYPRWHKVGKTYTKESFAKNAIKYHGMHGVELVRFDIVEAHKEAIE